jgi:hypothetical protein
MKKISICFLILLISYRGFSQDQKEFVTPWYGIVGLLYNSGHYEAGLGKKNVNLFYFDLRAVVIQERRFIDVGGPVAGWLATRVFGGNSFVKDEGEVSYIYAKYGVKIFGKDKLSLGVGLAGDVRGVSVKDIGTSVIGYYGLSPLIYAKLNVASLTILPIAEFNLLYGTSSKAAKRRGFTLGTHVVIPFSEKLAININPSFETAVYKFKDNPNTGPVANMTSANFFLKVGLVKTFD